MICRWHQWRISAASDARSPVAGWTLQHAESCPQCALHLATCKRLAQQPIAAPVPPPGLHSRIMAAVSEDRLGMRASALRRPSLLPAWAAAAALLLLGGLYYRTTSQQMPPSEPSTADAEPAAGAGILSQADRLVTGPLQEEGQRIAADLKATGEILIAALDPIL
jgi:hypothetical protein